MSDLFGNHIVGFPTRRLKYSCCHFPRYVDADNGSDLYLEDLPNQE